MTDDTSTQLPSLAARDHDAEPSQARIGRALLWRALVGVVALTASVSASAWLLHAGIDPQADPWSIVPPRNTALDAVRSWTIAAPHQTVAGDADLVVIDSWRIAAAGSASRSQQIAALRRKADGGERIVVARLSLTQMCEREPHWRAEWAAAEITTGTTAVAQHGTGAPTSALAHYAAAARHLESGNRHWRVRTIFAPSWVGNENPAEPGCWHVQFSDAGWLARLAGGREAAIDLLIRDGVDGVLLDVDYGPGDRIGRIQLRELIARIARRARDARSGFIVALGIGGEELADRRLLRMIDALAVAPLPEETVSEQASIDQNRQRTRQLAQARTDGVMVLMSTRSHSSLAARSDQDRIDQLGFVRQVSSAPDVARKR